MIRISTEFGRIPTKSFENLSSSSQAEPSMKQATSCGWLRYFGSIWGGSEESVDRMRMCPLDSGWRQTDMRTNPSCEMDSVLGNHWWNACNATVGYTWHLAGFTGIFGWIHSNPLMRHKSLLLFLYWQRWCRCQRRWSPCWRGAPFLREWIHCRMWPLLQFLKWLRHLSKKNKQKNKQSSSISTDHCSRNPRESMGSRMAFHRGIKWITFAVGEVVPQLGGLKKFGNVDAGGRVVELHEQRQLKMILQVLSHRQLAHHSDLSIKTDSSSQASFIFNINKVGILLSAKYWSGSIIELDGDGDSFGILPALSKGWVHWNRILGSNSSNSRNKRGEG